MSKFVFDIETNGLLLQGTRCWIVAAKNLETNVMQYWLEDNLGWQKVFDEATLLIGHNIMGFDIPMLEKLYGWKPKKHTRLEDTLILSQVLDYKRFGSEGHSMEAWGVHFGQPKVEHEDWTQYSEEMKNRCLTDVDLNIRIWDQLKEEAKIHISNPKKPYIRTYLQAEYAASRWNATASLHGWPFDLEKAVPLLALMKDEMDAAHIALSHKLGTKAVAVDKKKGIVEAKSPAWTKIGAYAARTADWFGIDPYTGQDEDRLLEGDYSRVTFEPLDLDSVQDVKVFLYRNGWEPTEWNTKRVPDPKRPERLITVNTTPKVTEDSLEFLGGDGKLYCDFLSTKSRYGVLKTWIEAVDEGGNLHGEAMLVGTPSMRARHSLIVNVPAVDSTWGKEMRGLFKCKPGWKLIGCDSAGNQARGLAHYLQSEEYVKLLLEGDIHQYNADKLTEVLQGMKIAHKVPRARAKRILYAFLFGASGAKLWGYIFDVQDKEKGNKLKNGFQKAVPGLKALLEVLEKIFASTRKFGSGYIVGIGGNRIYCDSFHKLLVYLLQACEKATCSTALMLTANNLEAAGIPYQPCIYYHDEIDFMVPEEYAIQAAAIGKQAFIDGPKMYDIDIMDGEAKIGDTWYEVH